MKKVLFSAVSALILSACADIDLPENGFWSDVSPADAGEVGLFEMPNPTFILDGVEVEPLPPPADGELGSLEQPIFMPDGYGSEEGDQSRCDTSWSGGKCVIPDNRSPNFGIDQCGTETSLFHRNIWTALGYTFGVVNSSPLDWAMTRSHSNGGDYIVRCVGDTTGAPMSTSFNGVTADCHDTDRGTLCQAKSGTITVRMGVFLQNPAFANATAAEQDRIIQNMLRHEAGHVNGLGHKKGASYDQLMAAVYPNAPGAAGTDPWANMLTHDSAEIHMLDCYRETSGTTSRCP